MNEISRTRLDTQGTKRMHKAWKTRIPNFVQSPLPWGKKSRKETNQTSLGESLETLLTHKCGQAVFRNFLKSEFCEENLDFWLACQELKNVDNPEKLRRRARRIYEEYIRVDATKEINLDFDTRQNISLSLQQPSPTCFAVAQKKVYSLMENGSFPRFIQSEQFKVLVHAGLNCHGKQRKALNIQCNGELIQNDF